MFKKRIPAVIIMVAILFTTVFSISIIASAATSYTPRLSAPSSSNEYYYSSKNIFYKYGYGMPNCTAYAYGRAYEILGEKPNLCIYGAEEWFDYNKDGGYYSYGSTPKLGAIACWYYNGGSGHVAVVEKIENGIITFSNSAYSGQNFYITTAKTTDPNAGGSSWWNFQGYIYIGDFESSETTESTEPTEPTTPVEYKKGIYKTDVNDSLNMRSGAGTSYSYVGSIPDGATLTVTDVKKSGSYNWGYTTYKGVKGWVALEFCKYVGEIPTTQPTTVPPTTVQPTTVQPTTVQPTTVQPTTVQPTTVEPTTQPTTAPQEIIVGDINADGLINVLDATEIQKYLSQLSNLSEEKIKRCDFNGDGIVSVIDSTEIQKYLANV